MALLGSDCVCNPTIFTLEYVCGKVWQYMEDDIKDDISEPRCVLDAAGLAESQIPAFVKSRNFIFVMGGI
jgi:hypothetical protein